MPLFAKFKFGKRNVISGSDAAAIAAMLCRPKVVAAYPITPQTIVVERLAEMISNGEMDAEMVKVESEHSAASVQLGAQATGVRTVGASCSQGLALMHEVLHVISGLRLPCVMLVVNRALSAPISIWNDHSDTMAARDTGWIQLHCENNQEVFDTVIQAYKIAEDEEVLLPIMVCFDGYILSHLYDAVDVATQSEVDKFLPPYKPAHSYLDPKKPLTIGAVAAPNSYTEFKQQQQKAMGNALKVIKRVSSEYSKKFGKSYGNGLIEQFKVKDAGTVIVAMGSVCGTIKSVVERRKDVGLLRVKSFRPFPNDEIIGALSGAKKVAVIDKAVSFGNEGPLFTEIKAVSPVKKTNGFIMGLGGRPITVEDVEFVIRNAGDEKNFWVNVNE
jgi:pyruvate ferredoxin oxidoreductase alpha subunit